MKLSQEQINLLKDLMVKSARKGNLANAGLVPEKGKTLASAESLVASDNDATAHSERMLVERVCKLKKNHITPGLTMITVVEPCLMCLSACSQAAYKQIAYIIPAKKYVDKISWMTDTRVISKREISSKFSEPIKYIHLDEYEEEFGEIFEKEMSVLYKIELP